MNFAYELALLGEPSNGQVDALQAIVADRVAVFGLTLGIDIGWHVRPRDFAPSQRAAAAALFFGSKAATLPAGTAIARRSVPIIPVVSALKQASAELPPELRKLNAIAYDEAGPDRLVAALLECAGLLPRQRRVFLSYRRDEARAAALQLFDAFSARQFDVFLDTHGVAPGDDFQSTLWHRLVDSDVLVMLDTKTYFESRWTSAEFGRALAKNISVLRVAWPDSIASPRVATTSQIVLADAEVIPMTGQLTDDALSRICSRLESVRGQSIAIRRLNLMSGLIDAVERIQGRVDGISSGNGMHLTLADGQELVAYPTVGVPTSRSLHDAVGRSPGLTAAVLYDHVGIGEDWLKHLDWLGTHVTMPRWIRASEASWQLADWSI